MHVALTGVSGFIGSAIARHLRRTGHSVTGLVRATSPRDHVEPYVDRFVVADQADPAGWGQLLERAECVIHNSLDWRPLRERSDLQAHLSGNLAGSIGLLEAAAPRQFVFISTIAVHHDILPRWGGRIEEDHPLRPASLYGAYKAAVEAHLWAAHFSRGQHTCAVRPCGVYGIDPRLQRSIGYTIVNEVRAGGPFRRPGGGKFVHVEDVAAAVTATVGNPSAAGRAYNLADCYARWADWAQAAADLLGLGVQIDMSSPAAPTNVFAKDAARTLGVELDRGHEGIRQHLRELITAMDEN
ncbi:MAG: NAD-dependent epimerase/dehydratase family protein [Planctomycetota bacterium]|jgi:nucleoside-diphosphate-sugar epimerase